MTRLELIELCIDLFPPKEAAKRIDNYIEGLNNQKPPEWWVEAVRNPDSLPATLRKPCFKP